MTITRVAIFVLLFSGIALSGLVQGQSAPELGTQAIADPADQYGEFVVPDNDIELFSSKLFHIVRRWRAGEHFEPLPELEAALAESPAIPSTHFWVGARKFLLTSIDGKDRSRDKEIRAHFKACLLRAKRAKALPKFKHAGLFYEGLCNGALGALHIRSEDYLDAGVEFRRSIQALAELHKQRPDHHTTAYILGAYHYNTSRMGRLGKLLMRLLSLPVGDREKGLKLLNYVAKPGNPADVLARLTLIDAYQYHEKRVDDAQAMLVDTLKMLPTHSGMLLLAVEFTTMHGRFDQAGRYLAELENHMPPESQLARLPEFKDRADYVAYVAATYRLLTAPKPADADTVWHYATKGTVKDKNVYYFATLYTAHLLKLAGLDDKANTMYERVIDGDGPRFLRDRAADFMEKRDIRQQIALPAVTQQALRRLLEDKALP